MNEIHITVSGSVSIEPELRVTQNGTNLCTFSIASSVQRLNPQTNAWESSDPSYIQITTWRKLAENVAKTLKKGTAVIVSGTLENNRYQKDGQYHNGGMKITATNVGVDLRNATAEVIRNGAGASNSFSQSTTPVQASEPAKVPETQTPNQAVDSNDPFQVNNDVEPTNNEAIDPNNPFGESTNNNTQTQDVPF